MKSDPFALYSKNYIKDTSVRSSTKNFLIDGAPPEQSISRPDKMQKFSQQFPIKYLFIIAVIFFGVIVLRVFFLQIVQGANYRKQAEGNRVQIHRTSALRGVIYDANGKLLVKNVPNFRLIIYGRDIQYPSQANLQTAAFRIAQITKLDTAVIKEDLQTSFNSGQPIVLEEHISYDKAMRLMIDTQNIAGVRLEIAYSREYLTREEYGPVLGYTGQMTEEELNNKKQENKDYLPTDDLGKTGIEKAYEDQLKGGDGKQEIEVDFQGREQAILSDTAPLAGANIHLTINSNLQQALYNALKKVVDEQNFPGASAVAMNPQNGKILSLVSYPAYDSNLFAQGISQENYQKLTEDKKQPLFNRVISGQFPSGSVFKPIVAGAALEEHVIDINTTFVSTGGITVGGSIFPDWKTGGHGVTNVIKGLAESVNTFFYYIGGGDNEGMTGLGVERITDYAKKFGLGENTGIDLFGEKPGFLPSKEWKEEFKNESWYLGDTYHLAIGQGDILVTPLQVASYTSIFANGGTYYQPHVVDYITNQKNETTTVIEPMIKNTQVISQESINIVRQGMQAAVLVGSAKKLQSLPVSAGAKTGTAQFGNEDKSHAWFTVFAPYDNPQIVLTILIEEGGEGSVTALPIAEQILQDYFSSAKTPTN
ncbi:MAG: penicillin-binding protein 2 [Candidatus Kerfeldbacteria bacterium RIFOXYA2_FULL_38_24]|uniref:Penicillin-binding protein 2 n=1 Tax=Candidatus Kerfeldbacteria bacterium RIFOXYB2_FULL_38_14 TaxID=1798547 RepID=A0A1G2BA93_9BACT|nr:MAG: penicillin-binding protein 2 [Candidatus Kerfeldbacteria bacterium RIFOXYA2_FULL_38_24]OGY86032.1 MAG: penicillin-binding protein 2 [Candidatus Kerfeldbacteria bacterium RIFOXYB2_FULL_38_14]OGY90148.1 MAG: penicillin-binding protein 2 [Candidatus Kerfeldbacteria bacterium RIFOXYC2_FULL_38_9]